MGIIVGIGTANFIHADDLCFDDLYADGLRRILAQHTYNFRRYILLHDKETEFLDKVKRGRGCRAQEVDHLFVYGMWI